MQPHYTKTYCRPFNHNNEALKCPADLLAIFRKAAKIFKELAAQKKICTPRSLLFKEERAMLEETLSNMDKIEEELEKKKLSKQ